MKFANRTAFAALLLAAVFCAGYVAAQNKFGAPSTIIHVSMIKWKPDVSEAEKQKALDGVKGMAGQIPGIKNVWIKVLRMQPRDHHAAFVIEFESKEAADKYAEHPAHVKWREHFLSIREASISPQITN